MLLSMYVDTHTLQLHLNVLQKKKVFTDLVLTQSNTLKSCKLTLHRNAGQRNKSLYCIGLDNTLIYKITYQYILMINVLLNTYLLGFCVIQANAVQLLICTQQGSCSSMFRDASLGIGRSILVMTPPQLSRIFYIFYIPKI